MNPIEALIEGILLLIGVFVLFGTIIHFAQKAERIEKNIRNLGTN